MRKFVIASVAAVAALGLSACSEQTQDAAGETADSMADDAGAMADDAGAAVEEGVAETGEAVENVGEATDQAAAEVEADVENETVTEAATD